MTQHKHAALSHWTPKGWVVNLGAGFQASWWDKDEAPLSGSDFLLEAQAREHAKEYMAVLRAQWVSRILGETPYNGRKNVDGGIWSSLAGSQTALLASRAVTLGPLGEELAEANERQEDQPAGHATVAKEDQQVVTGQDGSVTIPAVAHGPATGKATAMKSFAGGMQVLAGGGWKTEYVFEVPQAGRYTLTARVATVQEGQKFLMAANDTRRRLRSQCPIPSARGRPRRRRRFVGQGAEHAPLLNPGRESQRGDQELHADACEVKRNRRISRDQRRRTPQSRRPNRVRTTAGLSLNRLQWDEVEVRSVKGTNMRGLLGILVALALGATTTLQAADATPKSPDMTKPVKVFILMGQSNMVGMGKISGESKGKHGGPEGSLEAAVKEKKKYPYLVDQAGNWVERKDVRYVRVMVGKGGGMQAVQQRMDDRQDVQNHRPRIRHRTSRR